LRSSGFSRRFPEALPPGRPASARRTRARTG
jgi:hypothetical protein